MENEEKVVKGKKSTYFECLPCTKNYRSKFHNKKNTPNKYSFAAFIESLPTSAISFRSALISFKLWVYEIKPICWVAFIAWVYSSIYLFLSHFVCLPV